MSSVARVFIPRIAFSCIPFLAGWYSLGFFLLGFHAALLSIRLVATYAKIKVIIPKEFQYE